MIKGEENMSKIISVLEKLNLVEKANQETVNEKTANASDTDYVSTQEKIEAKDIEKDDAEVKPQYFDTPDEEKKAASKTIDIKQNSKLTAQEIYSLNGIENTNVNTIFMLGEFINALPESLPIEVRKKSIISIINSSNMNLDNLLADGKKRLDALDKFSGEYHVSTTNTMEGYKEKIAELRKLISTYEEQIGINETLLKEQSNIVKYESDKINNIIEFFNK